ARLLHYPDGSGGNNNYLTQVQNGATALAFSVPSVGNVVNYGANNDKPRIEPVALGGIKGRGLWLNGSYGVDFAPEETSSLYDQNIYVGLFVDSHSGKDHVNRKLVTFPDASSVRTIKMNACYSQQVCADSIPFDNIGFF